eukprot:Phypoly_transcript_05867.p1 GENE.Phypoly_transcript_05867~~Phypoly_transcript_05867.p1  ORF type:complete len:606 (+),score=97.46 Phypoly_transcript_05867:51-1868(+)
MKHTRIFLALLLLACAWADPPNQPPPPTPTQNPPTLTQEPPTNPSQFPYKGATGNFSPRRPSLPSSFDYIVIGAGTGGSVVANRLSEDPRNSVLLLERGSDTSNLQFVDVPRDWDITTVSQIDKFTFVDFKKEPVVAWNEAKSRVSMGCGLGGTTLINSEMFVRGNEEDYNRWEANYGATGWGYDDVLPNFKRVEYNPFKFALNSTYHSVSGPLHISPGTERSPGDHILVLAAEQAGLPFNPDSNGKIQLTSPLGVSSYFDLTIFNGTRQSAYRSYIFPYLNRANLWVVDSAWVTKINFSNKKRAISLSWFDSLRGEAVTSQAAKEIILSAGAIGTAKLLQISGIGNQTLLNSLGIPVVQNLPGVGQNLQEHLLTNLGVANTGLPDPVSQTLDDESFQEWVENKTGPYSTIGSRAVYFIRTKLQDTANDSRPDIQVLFNPPGSSINSALYLLRPKSRGYVNIFSSSPFVDPLPVGNFYTHPEDILRHTEGLRTLFKIFQKISPNITLTTGPANLTDDKSCELYLIGSRPYNFANSNTGQHWSGTAKIGRSDDEYAVVDARLRVYGVRGLRVADASVFPEITSGNTQAPTYMVGEKAAQMILDDNL